MSARTHFYEANTDKEQPNERQEKIPPFALTRSPHTNTLSNAYPYTYAYSNVYARTRTA